MTARQLEIIQHALGADKYGKRPRGSRNFFCAGKSDEADCRELVRIGLMQEHRRTEVYPYYNCSVTGDGINAMLRESPAPLDLNDRQRDELFYDDAWPDAFRNADGTVPTIAQAIARIDEFIATN